MSIAQSTREERFLRVNEANSCGNYAEALRLIDCEIERNPSDTSAVIARASTLYEWGRLIEAKQALLNAKRRGARGADVDLKLGWTCLATGTPGEAIEWMTSAAQLEPDSPETLFAQASAFAAIGQVNRAVPLLKAVLNQQPNNYKALLQLGELQLASNDARAAEEVFRKATNVRPNDPSAWLTLGIALDRQGRCTEAVEAIETAQRLEGESGIDIENFINLAVIRSDAGRFAEARKILEAELPEKPSIRGHIAYSFLLLRTGELRDGWNHYEFRLMQSNRIGRHTPQGKPPWTGQSLSGRTVLLLSEQGFGDTIQFVRYAHMLKESGATVWLQVSAGIRGLAEGFESIDAVFGDEDAIPSFDYYVHLASLPRLFQTELDTIPSHVPYVVVPEQYRSTWRQRVPPSAHLKVGLVWAGQPNHLRDWERSIAMETLKPLWSVEGVAFYSLQKGPASEQIVCEPELAIDNLSASLRDFGDTAAALEQLDLLISVDTAVAHLAGALGRPTWMLIPTSCDFRWLTEREDSPWYPTMRLFRQGRRGEWSDVVSRVADALREVVNRNEHRGIWASRSETASSSHHIIPSGRRHVCCWNGKIGVAETRYGIVQYIPSERPLGVSIQWYGEYLQADLDVCLNLLAPSSTVVEVSAGIGLHALALSGHVGEGGHVLVYEPRVLHQRILMQNLGANGASNVTIMRRSTDGREHGAAIDDLRLEKLDALKITSGSCVTEILQGASEALWHLRPMLLLQQVSHSNLQTLASAISDFGFRCWTRAIPLYNPFNFYGHGEDMFAGETSASLLAIPEEKEVAIEGHGFRVI